MLRLWLSFCNPELLEEDIGSIENAGGVALSSTFLRTKVRELLALDLGAGSELRRQISTK